MGSLLIASFGNIKWGKALIEKLKVKELRELCFPALPHTLTTGFKVFAYTFLHAVRLNLHISFQLGVRLWLELWLESEKMPVAVARPRTIEHSDYRRTVPTFHSIPFI